MQLSRRRFLRVADHALHPEPLRIGVQCLSLAGIQCRSCADTCPERALRLVPQRGGIGYIELTAGACSGCGECVPVCPVNAVHLQSEQS